MLLNCIWILTYLMTVSIGRDDMEEFWVCGICFSVSKNKKSYNDAINDKCLLGIVNTSSLLEGMANYRNKILKEEPYWVGAKKVNGVYKWTMTNESVDINLWKNKSNRIEDCVVMSVVSDSGTTMMRLDDKNCKENEFKYICQNLGDCAGKPTLSPTESGLITSMPMSSSDTTKLNTDSSSSGLTPLASTKSSDTSTVTEGSSPFDLTTLPSPKSSDGMTKSTSSSPTSTLTTTFVPSSSATDSSIQTSSTATAPITSSAPSNLLYSDSTFNPESSSSQGSDNISLTSTTVSLVTVSAEKPKNARCPCVCYFPVPQSQTLQEKVEDIQKELVVETKTLSSSVRKVTSAQDHRPSSIVTGTIGVIVISIVPVVVILMDLQRLLLFLTGRR